MSKFSFPSLPEEDECDCAESVDIPNEMEISLDFTSDRPVAFADGGCTCQAGASVRSKAQEFRNAWTVCGRDAKDKRQFLLFVLLTAYDVEDTEDTDSAVNPDDRGDTDDAHGL